MSSAAPRPLDAYRAYDYVQRARTAPSDNTRTSCKAAPPSAVAMRRDAERTAAVACCRRRRYPRGDRSFSCLEGELEGALPSGSMRSTRAEVRVPDRGRSGRHDYLLDRRPVWKTALRRTVRNSTQAAGFCE